MTERRHSGWNAGIKWTAGILAGIFGLKPEFFMGPVIRWLKPTAMSAEANVNKEVCAGRDAGRDAGVPFRHFDTSYPDFGLIFKFSNFSLQKR